VKRLLLDVNVLLDVLLDRDPWAESASALWAAVESGKARGFLPAHGVTTIHDLMRKARGGAFADRGVSDLLSIFGVARVDSAVLKAALALRFADFEDAVCAAAGGAARCDLLVTRDPAGFRGSPVEVASPGEALVRLTSRRKAAPARR
jgi:predicted nucleic acid-binding protein